MVNKLTMELSIAKDSMSMNEITIKELQYMMEDKEDKIKQSQMRAEFSASQYE